MTSGQEMEWVYSYNTRACTGRNLLTIMKNGDPWFVVHTLHYITDFLRWPK